MAAEKPVTNVVYHRSNSPAGSVSLWFNGVFRGYDCDGTELDLLSPKLPTKQLKNADSW